MTISQGQNISFQRKRASVGFRLGIAIVGVVLPICGFASEASTAVIQGAEIGPPPSACNTLLVVEKGDGTLSAFDMTSRQLVWRTPVGAEAHEVAVLQDNSTAYVSHYGGPGSDQHDLARVDLRTGQALEPADIAPLRSPHGLLARDGKIYFTAETNKVVGRWDPVTSRVDWVIGLGMDRTHMLASLPFGGLVTANSESGSVSIITPVTTTFAGGPPRPNWSVQNVPTGAGTQGLDVTPDGRFIWASAARDGVVLVVDVASRAVIDRVPLPWKSGNRLRITRDGKMALIAGNALLAIDLSTKAKSLVHLGEGRAEGLLLSADSRFAFVAVPQEGKVAIVSLPSLKIDGFIITGKTPDGLACYHRQ